MGRYCDIGGTLSLKIWIVVTDKDLICSLPPHCILIILAVFTFSVVGISMLHFTQHSIEFLCTVPQPLIAAAATKMNELW